MEQQKTLQLTVFKTLKTRHHGTVQQISGQTANGNLKDPPLERETAFQVRTNNINNRNHETIYSYHPARFQKGTDHGVL
jgi:hypothetical protein